MKFKLDLNNQYKLLNYRQAYFKDSPQVKFWLESGLTEQQLQMGIHQMSNPYPWMSSVVKQANKLKLNNISFAFHKITPGCFLPMHSDTYDYFKEKYSLKDISLIQRTIIFLEDALEGHILIVNNKCFLNWEAGDTVTWFGEDKHLAANLGVVDRYTLQITGIRNE